MNIIIQRSVEVNIQHQVLIFSYHSLESQKSSKDSHHRSWEAFAGYKSTVIGSLFSLAKLQSSCEGFEQLLARKILTS